jgi:hypothetical protein
VSVPTTLVFDWGSAPIVLPEGETIVRADPLTKTAIIETSAGYRFAKLLGHPNWPDQDHWLYGPLIQRTELDPVVAEARR